MKVDDVKKCSFESWYYDFKRVSFKSIIIPFPEGFTKYILEDGIVLPKNDRERNVANGDSDASSDEGVWDDSDVSEPEAPHFPEFNKCIQDAIQILGGKVFPKLNWSSPKDASWIAFNNSCCCTSISDIYLLLKSSDFIIHDITKPFIFCEDFQENNIDNQSVEQFYLVLRKWVDVDIAGEFRCFVKNNKLIGISQREYSLFFDHIPLSKDEIIEDIMSFFDSSIKLKFPLSNYVFDVYRKKKNQVYLIDFNPFGTVTESLLFDWNELNSELEEAIQNNVPAFRCVVDNCGVQPRILSYHALPRDIVDLSTGEDSLKLVDLMKLKIEEQNDFLSDEES